MFGGLILAIVVLLIALVAVARNNTPSQPQTAGQVVASMPNQQPIITPKVEILIAKERIEAGQSLMPYMFNRQAVDPTKLPEGAILARDEAQIAGHFAKEMVSANLPLLRANITSEPPSGLPGMIPPGFRAVTITVDRRSGVEGFAKPNKRVDVLWTYQSNRGEKRVATIVRFAKILSAGGKTGDQTQGGAVNANNTTVTLLVAELDAKKIELARQTGALSLALVGDKDPGKLTPNPEIIELRDLLPQGAAENAQEPAHDGVMYAPDPKTGKTVKWVLINGRWKREK